MPDCLQLMLTIRDKYRIKNTFSLSLCRDPNPEEIELNVFELYSEVILGTRVSQCLQSQHSDERYHVIRVA